MILLRNGVENDLDRIREIAYETWPKAYAEVISAEQISYMLEKMYNKEELLLQFQQGYTFLIAEENEKAIGFAVFSNIDSAQHIYKLHKLYVLPGYHGQGLGKLIINGVQDKVRQIGGKALELNVNRTNKATDFYKRAGFSIKEAVDLDIGNGFLMNDYVMQKVL